MKTEKKLTSRREFGRLALAGVGAVAAGPAFAEDATFIGPQLPPTVPRRVRRNVSSFRTHEWAPYFSSLENGAILADSTSRVLHYWSEDAEIYRLYPTSVPMTPELTRLGRTAVVSKKKDPEWRPTPDMLKRNPEWPDYLPPGPDNPLGTHALYLTWKYYRIHGTHDTRKIGRRSSNGCIGLYNEDIAELFELANPGTQVLLI